MIIRNAEINDLPYIVEIYNSTIPGRMVTADLTPMTIEDKLPWFNEHNKTDRPLWVAVENGRITAWLSFGSFYGRPAYHGTVELSIYIKEENRGKGLGKILLEKAIAEAPKIGAENLLAFIFAHNEPSLRLFKKFNFEKWAYMPGVAKLDGVYRDLVILGYKIMTK